MLRRLALWLRDEDGAMAPFLVLLLIPIIGIVALGTEVGGWYMQQRQLQNAADSAALAAAANANTNLVNGTASYKREAYGVAGQYGYQTTSDTTVNPTTVSCPAPMTGTCFQVTITDKTPLYLTSVIGYTGNTTRSDGRMATTVAATSIASAKVAYNYCLVGLSSANGNVKNANGNNLDLNGNGTGFEECAARSNGQVKCTSVDFGVIQAPNQQGGSCGSDYQSAPAGFTDPYAGLGLSAKIATAISGVACATSLPANITAAVTKICASTPIPTTNITITQTSGADPPLIVVYDTTWNTNGKTISTVSGSSATLIVTGAGATVPDFFSGDGNLSIRGSNGGVFDDFAVVIDPKYTNTNVFRPGGGSHVQLHTLGTVYMPNTDVGIEGSMDGTIGSDNCFALIAKSVYVNGGSLDNDPLDCKLLGFNLAETVVSRQKLVQ